MLSSAICNISLMSVATASISSGLFLLGVELSSFMHQPDCKRQRSNLMPAVFQSNKQKAPPAFAARGSIVSEVLLLLSLLIPMRQAIYIRRKQVHLVIPLQLLLRRHLALAAITDGLLQLREA